MSTTLQERIAELMEATGWKVGDIAGLCNISSSAVTQWKEGPTKSITLEPAIKLERASGFSALWIASGKGEKLARPASHEDDAEYAGEIKKLKRVPIVGTAKLGDNGFYEELSPIVGGGDGAIEMATSDPRAYGLRVRGQSMFPAIRDGWYVLVEPNATPATGEYVLVKLSNGKKMVKELLNRRTTSIEVMSVNGGERLSFDINELEAVEAVSAVVPPSKWLPD